ncbi:MAG TPA: hypothetical protein VE973_02295 [Candidatus Limnocylindria bacterium]|nr:hypothetical protein [Candidatus Limnocylindria bacterium]
MIVECFVSSKGGSVIVVEDDGKTTALGMLFPGSYWCQSLERQGILEVLEGEGIIDETAVAWDAVGIGPRVKFVIIPPGQRTFVKVEGSKPMMFKCVQPADPARSQELEKLTVRAGR